MTTQEIKTAINKEWNSQSMTKLTVEVDGVLDLRMQGGNPLFKDLLNNVNHILGQIIAKRESNPNSIIFCIYAAVGVRVLSLYMRQNPEAGFPSMGSSIETLPCEGEPTKERILQIFLKSMQEDFKVNIIN